jgi:hypothetical protein
MFSFPRGRVHRLKVESIEVLDATKTERTAYYNLTHSGEVE